MKIIKHGEVKSTAQEIVNERMTCPVCGCEFECGSNEMQYDNRNEPYVNCPECSAWCFPEEDDFFTLDIPPHFPQDFYDFSGGVAQDYKTINDWIESDAEFFRNNPEETVRVTACGDSLVIALNGEDGIHFYVAKGYYQASIEK